MHFYNPATNSWSIIGDTGVVWLAPGLAYNARENRLYGFGFPDTTLYRINPINAATAEVGDTGIPQGGGLGWVAPLSTCPWDLDGDGNVGIVSFLELLGRWGPCPLVANACSGAAICGESFLSCNGSCFCFQVDYVSGACIADFPCPTTYPCPPQGCPPGFICVTNSCCGEAVCVPLVTCNRNPAAGDVASPVGHTGVGYIEQEE